MNVKGLSDYELICLCLKGEQIFFEELVNRYKNLVYSIVVRMINDKDEADDLAQEIFIKIYRNLDKYQTDYKFSTWIIRISTNHVIDYHRKKRVETTNIEDVEYELPSGSSPEEVFFEKEKSRVLSQALQELPDMYKVPLVLYHQQSLSYQEIADVINEPLSKVKNRIFRGRKMLKENLISRKGDELYGLL